MYFQPGKRKGNPGIRVFNVAKKTSTIVNLPATISDSGEVDNVATDSCQQISDSGSPTEGFGLSNDEMYEVSENECEPSANNANMTYQVRKARLTANWEKIRTKLAQTSLLLEGFIPPQCTVADCSNQVEVRCRDCEFGAYYCLDCCDKMHKDKFQFHLPEVYRHGSWIQHKVPGRVLHNPFHVCSGTYQRPITVIDIRGSDHEVKFEYCTCSSIPESLLCHGLWAATPVEPTLAFTLGLMKMTLALRILFSRNQLSEGANDNQYTHLIVVMKSLNNRLLKLEAENKIATRWTPTDSRYMSSLRTQEMVKAKQTRDMMLVSGRRRWFLLSLKKKYADGQAQAKRLSKSITKESANLRKLLKVYNSSVDILRQHGYKQFSLLTWEVASDVSSPIYTTDVPSEDIIPLSIKRAAIDAYSLVQRCKEEQEILEQEMASCVDDFYTSCSQIESCLENLENNESFSTSHLLKGLYSLQRKDLDWERFHLFVASNLYQGSIAVCEDVRQYVDEHFRKTSVEYECDAEDIEDDDEEEEENIIDDDNSDSWS